MAEKKRYVVICPTLYRGLPSRSISIPKIMMSAEKFLKDYPDGLNESSLIKLIQKYHHTKIFCVDVHFIKIDDLPDSLAGGYVDFNIEVIDI